MNYFSDEFRFPLVPKIFQFVFGKMEGGVIADKFVDAPDVGIGSNFGIFLPDQPHHAKEVLFAAVLFSKDDKDLLNFLQNIRNQPDLLLLCIFVLHKAKPAHAYRCHTFR